MATFSIFTHASPLGFVRSTQIPKLRPLQPISLNLKPSLSLTHPKLQLVASASADSEPYNGSITLEKKDKKPIDLSKLWILCEKCHKLNYRSFFLEKKYICEGCGSHLRMGSSERIELLIDQGTWHPMDEDMVSIDPIQWDRDDDAGAAGAMEFLEKLVVGFGEDEKVRMTAVIEAAADEDEEEEDEEEAVKAVKVVEEVEEKRDETYVEKVVKNQVETGLPDAIQTGIGQLNGITVALGVMDFEFIGGSMGSVVGEKITRLIEFATEHSLPLILVCASGGARMQEGSLSLMQMAKISSALYTYQSIHKLFYISLLTTPTTGGVTASFAMLGDIIIAEPDATIAFAGKRVIEETLKEEVLASDQETDCLFEKGLFDLVLPRDVQKDVLAELLNLHGFFSNQNQ